MRDFADKSHKPQCCRRWVYKINSSNATKQIQSLCTHFQVTNQCVLVVNCSSCLSGCPLMGEFNRNWCGCWSRLHFVSLLWSCYSGWSGLLFECTQARLYNVIVLQYRNTEKCNDFKQIEMEGGWGSFFPAVWSDKGRWFGDGNQMMSGVELIFSILYFWKVYYTQTHSISIVFKLFFFVRLCACGATVTCC